MASISSFLRMFKNKNTWKPWPNFSGFHAWDSHGWCRLSRPSWYHERQQGPQHRGQGEVQAYWIIPGIRKHMVFEASPSWAQFWILSFIRFFDDGFWKLHFGTHKFQGKFWSKTGFMRGAYDLPIHSWIFLGGKNEVSGLCCVNSRGSPPELPPESGSQIFYRDSHCVSPQACRQTPRTASCTWKPP